MKHAYWLGVVACLTISCAARIRPADASDLQRCRDAGWQEITLEVSGQPRRLLFRGPAGAWENGAILVLHGGGGKPEDFCGNPARLLVPQLAFSEMAIEQKFGVFLLDSTNVVTDHKGKVCGKIWDDEVRPRANLDLPYLRQILTQIVPARRPGGSSPSVFLAGHSSGGYMSARAATHLGHLFQAFAGISSGDPYGWTRNCDPSYGDKRETVKGAGFDNETGKEIIRVDSCLSDTYAHEAPWDQFAGTKPRFRMFRNDFDGINDASCNRKIDAQLRKHGFAGEPAYVARRHDGKRRLLFHFWASEYNSEILAFFKRNR